MCHHKSMQDRLSTLPTNVIDDILVLLPIRDAVRTSILSRYWRNIWTSIPKLVFNAECAPTPTDGSDSDNLHRVRIVDKVLLCHKGPIHKFECSEFVASCPDIDQWIEYLSSHGIKEIVLHLVSDKHFNYYQVPSSLFSCHSLCSLELTNCTIHIPPTFSGLANLRTLMLNGIKMSDGALKDLVSKCRLLEKLQLRALDGITHIEIHSLNLKKLSINRGFQSLQLTTPHLASVAIFLHGGEQMNEDHDHSLIKALGSLLSIQTLALGDRVLQRFSQVGKTPRELLPTYKQLKRLFLIVNFTSSIQMATARCFMASAPYLQDLAIMVRKPREGSSNDNFGWEAHVCPLNCLLWVEMRRAMGSENELGLLELVLANAPVLRMVIVVFSESMSKDQEMSFSERLIQFHRASPQARVKCM